MQPLVSIICLTYNQRHTVREAIESLLQQKYSNLEILISDDCSQDGTYEKVKNYVAKYDGPHHVKISQNVKNLGVNANYNKVFSLARGELILIASGDDVSLPDRVLETVNHWLKEDRKPKLIASPVFDMREDGAVGNVIHVSDLAKTNSLDSWLKDRPYVIGAGHAWHRSLFHGFSPLPIELNHEDQVASYRAALLNCGSTMTLPVVRYRRGGSTGKIEIKSHQEWLGKRYVDARRDSAFWQQLVLDMTKFPDSHHNFAQVTRNLNRCLFEVEIISASSFFQKVSLLLNPSKTDIAFRVRTFFNVTFAKLIFLWKKTKI